jgi:hypothetical protein
MPNIEQSVPSSVVIVVTISEESDRRMTAVGNVMGEWSASCHLLQSFRLWQWWK